MNIIISDQTLAHANMTPDEMLLEIACHFYEKKLLSIGQARHLAGVDLISFQKGLSERGIYINYDIKDLETDLKSISTLP